MAHLPSQSELSKALIKNKGEIFGKRVAAWFVVGHLMLMKDDKDCTGYTRKVVNVAIDMECDDKVNKIWAEIKA